SVRHVRDSLATMRTRSALERRWIVRFMTGPVLMVLLAGVVGHSQPGGLSSPEPPGAVTVPGRVVDGVTFVAAGALGVALGDVVTTAGDVLTWRGSEGVATFFLGSADALLQRPRNGGPDERALSAPPLLVPGGSQDDVGDWLLPLDAVQLVGVAADWVGGLVYLRLPGGENVVVAIVIDAVQDDASFLPA